MRFFFGDKGRVGKYFVWGTASEAGILSFRKFAKSMPEKFKLAHGAQTVNFSGITQIPGS